MKGSEDDTHVAIGWRSLQNHRNDRFFPALSFDRHGMKVIATMNLYDESNPWCTRESLGEHSLLAEIGP